jgi:integrase
MGRKPKYEKETITVVVQGTPIAVTLHPPTRSRTSWYAYWNGLVSSKSTGQRKLEDAILAAENMVRNGGRRADLSDAVLSDDEFDEIQRVHFGRKTDEKAKQRAKRSFESCMEAIAAFREITGLKPITFATPDDCAAFQRTALTLPNQWRRLPMAQRHLAREYTHDARALRRTKGIADSLDDCPCYSPNNVLKWSRSLQAAFERANRNALKRKCVRGVVDETKLLTRNPWSQFTWIEGRGRPIRHFDATELLSLLAFFESRSGMSVGSAAVKLFLWSCCRKLEVASLAWDSLRLVGEEIHFEIVGKWGVEKWFRVPEELYQELLAFRTESPFVFAAYCEQIRQFHDQANPGTAQSIQAQFVPKNFARWLYERVKEWGEQSSCWAYVHAFRKTALQLAWDGEDEASQRVADDAGVSESVLLTHYVKPKLWRKSNRTYYRILTGLPPEVANRYGYRESSLSTLERELKAATVSKDWPLVAELALRLAKERQPEVG